MKKVLIVAALVAASLVPAGTVYAAAPAASAKITAQCFLLPLLPDCLAMWKADGAAMMKVSVAAPKTAMTMPKMPMMPAMPNCTKAAAGSGHLYDCKM
jgi:hypothetical protein